jgi:signal transduction histidine kinase
MDGHPEIADYLSQDVIYRITILLNANDINMETALDADDNVTIGDIIEKAVEESGIKANGYLTFSIEAGDDVKSMMILTNEAALTRALSAVLDNAGKFTTEGGVKLIVSEEASKIKFVVEDTGSGIPAEDAEKIFEPFTKLNSFFDGAGIGLTAARSIARRLNGDLVLDGSYTTGARFALTVPE